MNIQDQVARLYSLQRQQADLEKEIDSIKEQIEAAYPDLKNGVAPPFCTLRPYRTVKLDADAASRWYMNHPDHRGFFSLKMSPTDFKKLSAPIGEIHTSYSIKPDAAALLGLEQKAA